MEGVYLAQHLLKVIEERKERILEMKSSGAVKDMEEYRHLVGSMESMDYMEDELKQLLKNHTE